MLLCAKGRLKPKPQAIKFNHLAAKAFLGFEKLSSTECIKQFESLECKVSKKSDYLTVTPPTWRNDIKETVDLYEELARLIGFDKIPSLPPFNLELSKKESPAIKFFVNVFFQIIILY